MFKELFGSYLIESGKLTVEQYSAIKESMKSMRVKLGIIAVSEKFITEDQADEINRAQAAMDKRFGDIAIEKGYLTDDQVCHLLSMQGNPFMQFTQATVELGFMTISEIDQAMSDYQQANNFSDDDIDSIKTGDVDRISSVFVKSGNEFVDDLFSLALRNIIRFISTEITISKVEELCSYEYEHIAGQEVKGDHQILLAFAGNGKSLLSVASTFAKEEFSDVDEDAYDSVCEFTNCINGLYASKLSKEGINIDMLPPLFFNNGVLKSSKIYKLPMTIMDSKVDLIMTIDEEYKIG